MADIEQCLFYVWPCATTDGWSAAAAWAQALLSALAILAASWLAKSQDEKQIARRCDAFVSLIDSADQSALRVLSAAAGGFMDLLAAAKSESPRLLKMAQALEASSLTDVPDFRLVTVIHDVAIVCRQLGEKLEALQGLKSIPDDDSRLKAIARDRERLIALYNYSAKVANEFASPTIAQRLRRLSASARGRR
ncbi:hypothetical protein [Pseudoxanthomonas winnipegensis]|uniref:Uncharacterized protein n=1 Tax=Pseudoxanthomonas winnipegensis TaxID=2480810 RepID=A0A4Q8LXR5_9GAMM|nr:hypothetical protein [Pseudoxanthomonas winnipegensis]RZZ90619.1 hypothetical protein EA663_02370 [Pseudoxanthomonas winnipegensis]TAA37226.1 hypothetical protein EA656_00670 [Pseudoxanthomonas winnipegensis]